MTQKIGRNDRCPCGSGKKYKRCCLALGADNPHAPKSLPATRAVDQALWPPTSADPHARSLANWSMERTSFTPLAARHLALGRDLPDIATAPWIRAQIRERLGFGRGGDAPRETIASVRALATDAILERLGQLGVAINEQAFLATAEGHDSAWEMGDLASLALDDDDSDFVGLAFCELWRRRLPARPSLEMLDESIQTGFDLRESGDAMAACKVWAELAVALLPRLPADVRTIEQASRWFPGLAGLDVWSQEFAGTIFGAAVSSEEMARRGAAVFGQLAERFEQPEDHTLLLPVQAHCLAETGDFAAGAELLEQLIAEAPDDAAGYVELAELHTRRLHAEPLARLEQARHWLNAAAARPVSNAKDWDLAQRLEDLARREAAAAAVAKRTHLSTSDDS